MSLIRTSHISGGRQHSSFCMSDGSVRMIGNPGKFGSFGFDSSGRAFRSTISSSGVIFNSVGNKVFVHPPKIQDDIVQCVSNGVQTFALIRDGVRNLKKVIYWGSFLKKQIKNIPPVATSIICIGSSGFVFVNEYKNHYYYNTKKGNEYVNKEMIDSSTSKVILSCFLSIYISYCYREDGICHIGYIDVNEQYPSFKKIVVKNCHWVVYDASKVFYCYGKNRDIESIGYMHSGAMDKIMLSFPKILQSVKSIEYVLSQDCIVILTNTGQVHTYHNYTNELRGPYVFSFPVSSINSGFAILQNGIAIPLINNMFSKKDEMKVLSAIPEWSDDEDAVYDICKINPDNFLFASKRLRKSIPFSKKIILIGSHVKKYIDGVVRRNPEIRPIIKLYELSELHT